MEPNTSGNLVTITCAVILTVLIGWLIVIGQSLLLPIVIGVIFVYILTTVAEALGRMPGGRALPRGLRLLLVGLLALGGVVYLVSLTMYNAGEIAQSLPEYSQNLQRIFDQASAALGLKSVPSVSNMLAELQRAFDLNKLAGMVASGVSGALAAI